MSTELDWTDDGPRSQRYDDVYFSRIDGLAESRAVFLEGCGLPGAWAGRERFTVAELGFGTGLNIAALLTMWRRTRPPGGYLSIFSVEAHLIARDEAARALGVWPELAEPVAALLAAWPEPRRGFHRLDLAGWGATLDLFIGDVEDALARWSGRADAWFLDGFAPAKNPQMWRDEVLAGVGALSAPGARAATFTVAGPVRRALAAAGFAVEKRPGFGAKRERLEARLPSSPPQAHASHRAIVIGAGVAGASLVRALDRQGVSCTLIEAAAPGAGASGNPAALVTPRLDAGFGPAAELYAQAFARAVQLYGAEIPGSVVATGALQLAAGPKDLDRFIRIAQWDGFAPGELRAIYDAPAGRLDGPDTTSREGLLITRGLTVEPAAVLDAWLAPARRIIGRAAKLQAAHGGWLCLDDRGGLLCEAEAVFLAPGAGMEALAPGLGLRPVRGQAEFARAADLGGPALAWGPYVIPLPGGGVLFGASHVRGDLDTSIRPEERRANLAALAARLPDLAARVEALGEGALQSRAATRMATADHLPLAGETSRPGLYLLGGLGGRGFTLAPLLAEHLAALAVQAPSPLSVDLARRMRPERFAANRATVQPLV